MIELAVLLPKAIAALLRWAIGARVDGATDVGDETEKSTLDEIFSTPFYAPHPSPYRLSAPRGPVRASD